MRITTIVLLSRDRAACGGRRDAAVTGTSGCTRIRTAPYSADQVYRLTGFVGYQTDLEFETGETFVGLGRRGYRGDLLRRPGQSSVPEAQGREGRDESDVLTITAHLSSSTTRRVRRARIAMRGGDLRPALHLSEHGGTTPRGSRGARALLSTHRPRTSTIGSAAIRRSSPSRPPMMACTPGLTFAAKAEQPAIFVLNDDGSESLLNFSMDEGDVILHRVARRFILRRGQACGLHCEQRLQWRGRAVESRHRRRGCGAPTRGVRP